MNICTFGNLKKSGYWGSLSLLLPQISFTTKKYLDGRTFRENKISLPTKICFTNNNYCVRIKVSLLGFGLKFVLFERRNN